MEAAHLHSCGHEPAKREAWEIFSACFARETFQRGGASYEPRYAGKGGEAREALKWAFYFRDLTCPEDRLKPFSLFGIELGPRPRRKERPAPRPEPWGRPRDDEVEEFF